MWRMQFLGPGRHALGMEMEEVSPVSRRESGCVIDFGNLLTSIVHSL